MQTTKHSKQRNWVAMALAGSCFWIAAGQAQEVPTNSVTWSGGGAGTPTWDVAANWLANAAPTNPTTATVIYTASGTNVTGVLDGSRTIGKLSVADVAGSHTLDLGGRTLTVAGNFENRIAGSFTMTNGTLRVGTDAAAGDILMGNQDNPDVPTFTVLRPGMTLDTYRVGEIQVGRIPPNHINNGNARFDLRGVTVAGGTLKANTIRIQCTYRATESYLALDGTTALNALTVSNELTVGEGSFGGTSYIGDPLDAHRRLPAGLTIRVGTSPAQRGVLQIGKNGYPNQAATAILAAGVGGSFTAYLTALKLAPYEATYPDGNAQQVGTLDLAGMTNCQIDAQTILIAPNYSANASAQPCGTLRLCPGTVTAGTVAVGANVGLGGWGVLGLSNTLFTVTDSFTLNATASNSISVGTDSRGLDVQGTFTDGGGKITVNFLVAPALNTAIWAIRIKGDARATLNGMIDAGRLTSTGTYAYKKVAVRYDAVAGCTYYAMTDDAGTWGVPAVDHGAGPVLSSDTTAILRGRLVGGGAAYAGIAWGTNAVNLEHTNTVGMIPEGAFSVAVAELRTESDYYYRCFASNANGQAWAPQTTRFTPLFREVLALEQKAEFAQAISVAMALLNQSTGVQRRRELGDIVSRLRKQKQIASNLMSAITALEINRDIAERALEAAPEVAVLLLRQAVRQRDGAVLDNAVDILISMNDTEVLALLVDRIRTCKDPIVGLALVKHLERLKDWITPELAPACRKAIRQAGLGDTPAGRAVLAGCAASSQCLTD